MTRWCSRRSFLCGVPLAGAALGALATAQPGAAIEPISRPGPAKFKFSLAGYSYRKLLSGSSPVLKLEDFIADCAAMGLEGTEPTSYYFPKDLTPQRLRQYKHQAFRLGLDISGTGVGNDFCHPPGPKRDEQLALVKRWIEYAEVLGAPMVRIFAGGPKAGQTPDQVYALVIDAIEECCEQAAAHGVFLALENHGGLTATAEGVLRLVKAVKSPWFGVNLDTGNFRSADPYAELEKIAPYAINVHVKVTMAPAGAGKQPTDYVRIKKILTSAGYRGYITLEYEEEEDPRTACPRHLDAIRRAFA